jgi:hypothetical protein
MSKSINTDKKRQITLKDKQVSQRSYNLNYQKI